jgi:monoamine oxidase
MCIGAQQDRIKGGSYNVSETILERYLKNEVILNTPVDRIDQTDPNIVRVYSGNKCFECQYVILAIPPGILLLYYIL